MDAETQAQDHPDPAIMRGVIPYLEMRGASNEAIAFWTRAFAAREVARIPLRETPSKLLHAHLEINGGSLMMTDWGFDQPGGRDVRGLALQLVLSEADGHVWWTRAIEAGCVVVAPFERTFWGAFYGRVRDPFGVEWAFNAQG